MDAKSIITQVSPDEVSSVETKPENKVSKGSFITKLLCCFGFKKQEYRDSISSNNCAKSVLYERLLPNPLPQDANQICLVIDLDETLVHSSFKPIPNADFIIPVELDGVVHRVYVLKRPFVDEFLVSVGNNYECILFTASLAKYADPVTDLLDRQKVFRARLFRESCVFYRGNYVKDLGRLGRDLKKTAILDNSPSSYIFHPEHAVPISTWFDDPHDTELRDLIPFFETMSKMNNISTLIKLNKEPILTKNDPLKI